MKLNKILKNKKRAFTLAEVVIVMGILGVMMAAFAPVITKKTLAVGANSFRNFGVADGHVGLSYGTVADEKTVLIGDNQITANESKNSKLLIMTNFTDADDVNPQIGFGTYNSTGNSRTYLGELMITPGGTYGNIFLGSDLNGPTDVTNKQDFTAIGMGACPDFPNSTVSNVICLGTNSGPTNGTSYYSERIYIGDRNTQYRPTHIFFGSLTMEQMIADAARDKGWHIDSDIRLKNVGKEFTAGLDEINQLEFYNYTYKRDAEKDPKVGVMAQDLQKVFPNAVKENKDGYLYIRKDDMFYAALNAIKELGKMFTTNDEKIKALEERNAMLEQQNQELQNLYIELSKRVEKLDKKKTKGKLTITPEKEVEEEVIDPEFTLKSESTENSEE